MDGSTTTVTEYLDGFQYENQLLQFFPHTEGYVKATPANLQPSGPPSAYHYNYGFNYTDHLGNVRLSYSLDPQTQQLKILDETEVRGSRTQKQWRSHKTNNGEQTQYYPFGLKHKMYAGGSIKDFKEDPTGPGGTVLTNVYETDYQYKYNGKEFQDELGLGLYYYGARNYDPALGRWINVDPLAETTMQPYSYANNNPVRYADPTGMIGEDFVQRGDGSIYWDNNANSQATTKAGETYLGKNLSFTFNSYIGDNYDGPLGSLPEGNKLTTTINLSATENSAGELTGLSATKTTGIGETFGLSFLKGRDYYPGEGGSNNYFTKSGMSINYEQHASVPGVEESGLNAAGYKIVDVAQKLNISFDKGSGNLSVNAYTNVFPSATLKLNNTNTTLMNYTQPSFKATHTAPIKGWTNPSPYKDNLGPRPIRDFSYYPSVFYKRN